MNTSNIDKLRAIAAARGKHRAAAGSIAGLPEFAQITPPPVVAAYFTREPDQQRYWIDKVAATFNSRKNQLDADRSRFDRDLHALRSEHQLHASMGEHDRARELASAIARKESHFEERYTRELNLAKGSALVVANRLLDETGRSLASAERTVHDKEEARLRNMNTDELLRELIRAQRSINNANR